MKPRSLLKRLEFSPAIRIFRDRRFNRLAMALVGFGFFGLAMFPNISQSRVHAEKAASASASRSEASSRIPLRDYPNQSSSRNTSRSSYPWMGGGWGAAILLGTIGVAVVWIKQRNASKTGGASPRLHSPSIVGRTHLTPKHSVFVVRIEDRLLILGTGPQTAPSLLGEISTSTDGVSQTTVESPEPRRQDKS